ncbi:MAG: hypothetical protein K0M45_09150 [Candidatus Paracaedibacteraceae bacterium]|nr:hypothetical protein [Candidatus Paracaedibacteraceae bacterium]
MKLKYLATVTSTLTWILMHESVAADEHRHLKIFTRDLQNSVTTEQDICLEPAGTERLTIPPLQQLR